MGNVKISVRDVPRGKKGQNNRKIHMEGKERGDDDKGYGRRGGEGDEETVNIITTMMHSHQTINKRRDSRDYMRSRL